MSSDSGQLLSGVGNGVYVTLDFYLRRRSFVHQTWLSEVRHGALLTLDVNLQRLVFALGPVSTDQGIGLRDDVVCLFLMEQDMSSSSIMGLILLKSTF